MSDTIHIYPLDEEARHTLQGTDCRCNPRIEGVFQKGVYKGRLVVHNAFDGRHILEAKTEGKVQ